MKNLIISCVIFMLLSCGSAVKVDYREELEAWICVTYENIIETKRKLKTGEVSGEHWEMVVRYESENFSDWMAEYKQRYGRFFLPETECK